MKLEVQNNDDSLVSTFEGHEVEVAMDPALVIQLAIKQYRDQILAAIREPVTNACESHVKAGRADVPFEFRVTTDAKSNLVSIVVRDYGTGVSPEFLKKHFFSLGNSTKRDSEKLGGTYGLGAKAALGVSVGNIVSVTTYDGSHSITAHANLSKQNKIRVVVSDPEPCDELPGLSFGFALSHRVGSLDYIPKIEFEADDFKDEDDFVPGEGTTGMAIHYYSMIGRAKSRGYASSYEVSESALLLKILRSLWPVGGPGSTYQAKPKLIVNGKERHLPSIRELSTGFQLGNTTNESGHSSIIFGTERRYQYSANGYHKFSSLASVGYALIGDKCNVVWHNAMYTVPESHKKQLTAMYVAGASGNVSKSIYKEYRERLKSLGSWGIWSNTNADSIVYFAPSTRSFVITSERDQLVETDSNLRALIDCSISYSEQAQTSLTSWFDDLRKQAETATGRQKLVVTEQLRSGLHFILESMDTVSAFADVAVEIFGTDEIVEAAKKELSGTAFFASRAGYQYYGSKQVSELQYNLSQPLRQWLLDWVESKVKEAADESFKLELFSVSKSRLYEESRQFNCLPQYIVIGDKKHQSFSLREVAEKREYYLADPSNRERAFGCYVSCSDDKADQIVKGLELLLRGLPIAVYLASDYAPKKAKQKKSSAASPQYLRIRSGSFMNATPLSEESLADYVKRDADRSNVVYVPISGFKLSSADEKCKPLTRLYDEAAMAVQLRHWGASLLLVRGKANMELVIEELGVPHFADYMQEVFYSQRVANRRDQLNLMFGRLQQQGKKIVNKLKKVTNGKTLEEFLSDHGCDPARSRLVRLLNLKIVDSPDDLIDFGSRIRIAIDSVQDYMIHSTFENEEKIKHWCKYEFPLEYAVLGDDWVNFAYRYYNMYQRTIKFRSEQMTRRNFRLQDAVNSCTETRTDSGKLVPSRTTAISSYDHLLLYDAACYLNRLEEHYREHSFDTRETRVWKSILASLLSW